MVLATSLYCRNLPPVLQQRPTIVLLARKIGLALRFEETSESLSTPSKSGSTFTLSLALVMAPSTNATNPPGTHAQEKPLTQQLESSDAAVLFRSL